MDKLVLMALIATLGTWFLTALGAATVVLFKECNYKKRVSGRCKLIINFYEFSLELYKQNL